MANVYRRGAVWWGGFERHGRRYRRSLKTTDRGVAERRLGQWIEQLEGVAFGEKAPRTFLEAAGLFIKEHLTTLKPSSAKRYAVSLKSLGEHFGPMELCQIKRAELAAFESWRRSQGVTAGTIRRDFACLSSLFHTAEDHEWIEDGANPVPSFLRRRAKRGLKETPPRTRYLSIDEEQKLLAATTPAVRDAIMLAIDTGLRREELFSLAWRQVEILRGVISTTTRTKSGRPRMVPIPRRSADILARLPRSVECPYVLVNPDTQTRYVQMNKGLSAAVRRAGIERLCWHDLRRTAGCRWLQRDRRSMAEVSMLLGHSSVAVTESRYAFLDAELVAQEVARGTKSATGTAHSAAKPA